ncbi:ABC transporter permease [Agitococcus lubricus]|uniref:Putative ABC transport system permease protein n=1 Tax=Agitococcus lubricus TaxID=1077255 RepID=A0A2T5IW82_9GAMM|nr:ABC transporter permease [Agitococcus lubricus]PTQ88164.1 putative ABC transport system permease protein [Agitococcus lubricus]
MLIPMLYEALVAMLANRLRSFLTMLGMMIGVASVVLMLAIGQTARDSVQKTIDSMGSHLFIVLAGSANTGGLRTGSGGVSTLTVADATAISELAGVNVTAPVLQTRQQLVASGTNWSTEIFGSTPDYLIARGWQIQDGTSFDDSDVRQSRRVALIGATVAHNLFADDNPIGQTLRIGRTPYEVIGVLAAKGQSLDGRDQDDTVIVPLTSAQRYLVGNRWRNSVRMILVQATDESVMPQVEGDMDTLLRERHKIAIEAEPDFSIRNLAAIAQTAAETAKTMSLLLGAIASISLVVGGIGIMNIMLVSVTERTREIGIRMAIGARQRDVLSQFLLESVMISVTGGIIGLLVGMGCAQLVGSMWQTSVSVSMDAVILAFSVAAVTGVSFGFYPAYKASRLDPIEALRYQ